MKHPIPLICIKVQACVCVHATHTHTQAYVNELSRSEMAAADIEQQINYRWVVNLTHLQKRQKMN